MLKVRQLTPILFALAVLAAAAPAPAQEFAPHRAVYSVTTLERGKPDGGPPGTYAYELKLTCDGYIVNQRLRLEIAGKRGAVVTEQQSQMTESRDARKLRFEHRTTANGRQTNLVKGEALLGDDGSGEARFADPEGQTAALLAGTLFPVAMARATIRQARAGEGGLDALFFFGDKVKPPQMVNVVIGRVPKRLAEVKIPEGAEELVDGRTRIYYRAGFFDAQTKGQGEPAFEMSSVTLDNGVELFGTHEQGDGGMEYRITRLEALPKPECN
ncbi:MAG: cell envelope integrity EipB family protein [Reyranella sp.]|nr:cell envelope integrity EipB family protein [Reyranella sp.]